MANELLDAIQMEVRSTKPCRKEFDFTVPVATVTSECKKTLKEFSGMASVPGFRQGKAPLDMIQRRFEPQIKEELQRKLAYAAFEKIGKDESLDVLNCDVDKEPVLEFNADFKFTLVAEIAPEFDLGDYQKIKSKAALDTVTDEQLAERVKSYQAMYGSYAAVEDGAKDGDMLKVSYKSNFELPENASADLKRQAAADNSFVWMSEPETIPGCIKGLTGAVKGKSYDFDAVYPADYRIAELAGKTVKYTVTVDEVQRRAELSEEELVKKVGAKSAEDFRNTVRSSMEAQNKAKQQREAAEEIYAELDKAAGELEFPEKVLAAEVQKELQKIARDIVKSEEDVEKFKAALDEHTKKATEEAKKALRRSFILRKAAKLEKVSISDADVSRQLEQMSYHYGCKPKELRDMLEKNGGMNELQLDILNNKVMEILVERALA